MVWIETTTYIIVQVTNAEAYCLSTIIQSYHYFIPSIVFQSYTYNAYVIVNDFWDFPLSSSMQYGVYPNDQGFASKDNSLSFPVGKVSNTNFGLVTPARLNFFHITCIIHL